jgi:hypothetical protein
MLPGRQTSTAADEVENDRQDQGAQHRDRPQRFGTTRVLEALVRGGLSAVELTFIHREDQCAGCGNQQRQEGQDGEDEMPHLGR